MSRKNRVTHQNITDGDMSQTTVTSSVTSIQFLDNIGIQLNATGDNIEGTAHVQVSADYNQDFMGNVTSAGNWVTMSTLDTTITAAGSSYIDITQLSAPWIRLQFENTFIGDVNIALVADSSGSLNNKYWLLDTDGTDYYIWYNINSAGVDPAVPNRTGIAVAGATNASATTLATATATALSVVTEIANITPTTTHVTFDQADPGPDFNAANSAGGTSPAFTFTVTAADGELDSIITAKMI